ncbi:MAG: hypothetical protein HYX97_04285 [Chloroflexi bacterium]|nr:hypothetical protein [Chloroflexota bacterium]
MAEFVILDPIGDRRQERHHLARRKGELSGATVGLFDNQVPNATLFLETVGSLLMERHGVAAIVYRQTNTGAGYDLTRKAKAPVESETLQEAAKRCDAAVVGVGH